MSALRRSGVVLLWIARFFGGVWLLISLLGLWMSGFRVTFDAGLFALSMAVATFAPQRWFIEGETRVLLLVLLLLGFLSPIRVAIEKWPQLLGIDVQITQTIPLLLFLCIVAIGGWSRGRGNSQGQESQPKAD